MQIDHTPGIMPQKTYIFWLLILIIFFMAAVNFTILVIMINVLRIGEGMESMEMLSNEEIIKLYGDTDFDYVLYDNGVLKGFQDIPIQINGNEGSVIMAMKKYNDLIPSEKIKLSSNEFSFTNIDNFEVTDPETQEIIFSTQHKNFQIPKDLSRLDVKKLRVHRLVSLPHSNLTLKSDLITRLRGNEGVKIRGKEVTFFADGDIFLKSVNGSIHLIAGNVTIDISRIPVVFPRKNSTNQREIYHYKLCVCMPQGVLFKVPVSRDRNPRRACSNVDLSNSNNPCIKF